MTPIIKHLSPDFRDDAHAARDLRDAEHRLAVERLAWIKHFIWGAICGTIGWTVWYYLTLP